ncbi:MAG: mechanosensitive ion channel family protein [Capsulimonadales bacterium]|nr:mechanosensitive ion channel family protein [Capsulimonadales bacterium]
MTFGRSVGGEMEFDFSVAWRTARNLIQDLIALLPNFILGVVVFIAFYFIGKTLRLVVRRLTERHQRARQAGLVLGRLANGAVLLVGLLVALSVVLPSFQPAQVIQFLGIGSVAIGFAFQDIFKNYLSGILILLTEPFRIGDQIVANGFEGTVEDIHTRATTLKTYDGRRVVIPNGDLFTNSVVVNTAFGMRRTEYDIGIGYGDDISRAREIILGTLRRVPGVLQEPEPDALVVALDASSINIRARWWSEPRKGEVLDVQDRALEAIRNALTENGIDLPFPTRQILFHDQTEETDGDRSRQREGWPAGRGEAPRPRPIASQSENPVRDAEPGFRGAGKDASRDGHR